MGGGGGRRRRKLEGAHPFFYLMYHLITHPQHTEGTFFLFSREPGLDLYVYSPTLLLFIHSFFLLFFSSSFFVFFFNEFLEQQVPRIGKEKKRGKIVRREGRLLGGRGGGAAGDFCFVFVVVETSILRAFSL